MPSKPLRLCSKAGCRQLTRASFCDSHKDELQKRKQKADRYRGTAQQRGYTYQWSKARTAYLLAHPLCVHCLLNGMHTQANIVDHIDPHKGDQVKFWDHDNWQALCKRHHDIKTAREDGGFGRKTRRVSQRGGAG